MIFPFRVAFPFNIFTDFHGLLMDFSKYWQKTMQIVIKVDFLPDFKSFKFFSLQIWEISLYCDHLWVNNVQPTQVKCGTTICRNRNMLHMNWCSDSFQLQNTLRMASTACPRNRWWYFSIKTLILMATHNICCYGEIWKIIPKLSPNTHPPHLFHWHWQLVIFCSGLSENTVQGD